MCRSFLLKIGSWEEPNSSKWIYGTTNITAQKIYTYGQKEPNDIETFSIFTITLLLNTLARSNNINILNNIFISIFQSMGSVFFGGDSRFIWEFNSPDVIVVASVTFNELFKCYFASEFEFLPYFFNEKEMSKSRKLQDILRH